MRLRSTAAISVLEVVDLAGVTLERLGRVLVQPGTGAQATGMVSASCRIASAASPAHGTASARPTSASASTRIS